MERFGPYRLEQTINVGSIGEVRVAFRDGDPPDRPVVVKRLHRELARQPGHVELFADEARMARRFSHPNLVHAFDSGTVETEAALDHYIAMDLVRGPNLAQLAARGPRAEPVVVRLGIDIAAGLAHIHEAGVVHCDVSPTNILIGPERTQLTDFGCASPAGEKQPQTRGTVAYMAPEQARGEPVDGRSDVFSLAIVLWELLAHRSLFHRAAPYLTLAAVVEDPVPPLGLGRLEEILVRALAKDPADRFASAGDLGAALAALG